jgi:tRNA threonylcarbamoyl adenosine modification protein (Sua5/YciO/YrdC/YwlC family)
MEFLPVSPEALDKAAKVLRSGGIVAFPTETVYGLGADAYNSAALIKIFEAKGRPHFDPLIIHIAGTRTLEDTADLSLLNEEILRKLFLLAENFWPGPLSLVLPKNAKRPGIATAGLSTAAIRFPAHEAAQKLISLSGGAVEDAAFAQEDVTGGLASPGQLKSHYALRSPLSVFNKEDIINLHVETDAAYLFFDDSSRDMWLARQNHAEQESARNTTVKVLSTAGNVSEAASCLFEMLHELDMNKFSHIFAQLAPQQGLGAAINDRLRRAGS